MVIFLHLTDLKNISKHRVLVQEYSPNYGHSVDSNPVLSSLLSSLLSSPLLSSPLSQNSQGFLTLNSNLIKLFSCGTGVTTT
jgi:hypothetical protein